MYKYKLSNEKELKRDQQIEANELINCMNILNEKETKARNQLNKLEYDYKQLIEKNNNIRKQAIKRLNYLGAKIGEK